MTRLALFLVCGALMTAGCAEAPDTTTETTPDVPADPQPESPTDAWWANMQAHCGNAFAGSLALAPPDDDMLEGDEHLVVHFRECLEEEMRVPFHIERLDGTWDRSRTWIFTRAGDMFELRHDHRIEDGTPDENTDYGGFTQDQGSADEQVFIFTDYDEYTPEGPQRGWRVQIAPNEHYIYGTFRGDDWSWRVDFDLSTPIDAPPAPWGHDDGEPS